jgi:hypothetical protein
VDTRYHKTPEATPDNGKQPKETRDKSQKDRSRTVYKIRDAAGRHIADHIRIDKPEGERTASGGCPMGGGDWAV